MDFFEKEMRSLFEKSELMTVLDFAEVFVSPDMALKL